MIRARHGLKLHTGHPGQRELLLSSFINGHKRLPCTFTP
uniref:Uncharacterized protein n=1 Tax=Nonomuraea gerenzanensis TaxID=93944 RepID=A0A1M4EC47_9ACTN|nr:hypothetical protein BN4615_P5975 [Nonomuraea gerenzanensis]